MCFYLRKSKGEEQRLNTRISRVMQYTLNSGLLTSACSLSALFTVCRCFLPHRSDFAHAANVLMLESVCSLAQHIRVRRSRVFVDPTCVHSSPPYYLPTQIDAYTQSMPAPSWQCSTPANANSHLHLTRTQRRAKTKPRSRAETRSSVYRASAKAEGAAQASRPPAFLLPRFRPRRRWGI